MYNILIFHLDFPMKIFIGIFGGIFQHFLDAVAGVDSVNDEVVDAESSVVV